MAENWQEEPSDNSDNDHYSFHFILISQRHAAGARSVPWPRLLGVSLSFYKDSTWISLNSPSAFRIPVISSTTSGCAFGGMYLNIFLNQLDSCRGRTRQSYSDNLPCVRIRPSPSLPPRRRSSTQPVLSEAIWQHLRRETNLPPSGRTRRTSSF